MTISEYKYSDDSLTAEKWEIAYDEGKAGDKFLDCTISYSENGYITHIQYPEDADGFPYWDYEYESKDGLITKIRYFYEGDEYEYQLEYDTSDLNTQVSNDRYVDYINTIE